MSPGYEHSVRTAVARARCCTAARLRWFVLACSALGGAACTTDWDVVAKRLDSSASNAGAPAGGDGNSPGGAGSAGNAGRADHAGSAGNADSAGASSLGGSPATCHDLPHVLWTPPGGSERTVCTAHFARERMGSALCSCGNMGVLGSIHTDSAAQMAASGAEAVGINGVCTTHALLTIGGSLTVAGQPADGKAALFGGLEVHGDLRFTGALTVAGPLQVGRDAWFGDTISALTVAAIHGDVHVQPGKKLDSAVAATITGQTYSEAFTIAPPCRCESSEALDWVNAIDQASKQNDNGSIELSSTLPVPRNPLELTLPCGSFYVTDLVSLHDTRLHVTGHAALFVAGNVSTLGNFEVDIAPEAELDLFVGGTFDFGKTAQVGDPARPSALRIYVAGTGSLLMPKETLSANLYAPLTDVLLAPGEFYGSIFAHTLSSVADVTVHYDAAVQRVADSCDVPGATSCTGCGQCGSGQACVAGVCSDCAHDDDCCAPQVCNGGRCVAFLE